MISTPFDMLGFRLGKLAQVQERLALAEEAPGLDARRIGVLMLASAERSLSQQAIGELLGIDRTTMVRLASELESEKLLDRVRRPEDRRSIQLVPTRRGRALAGRMATRFRSAEVQMVAVLTEEESNALKSLVAKLFGCWVLAPDGERVSSRRDRKNA